MFTVKNIEGVKLEFYEHCAFFLKKNKNEHCAFLHFSF